MRRREAGFTLTEMMAVVTIIGIMVTMAIVYMRGHVRPIDVANRVGDLIREANRRAVALGPVRSDVAVNMGTARTAITATRNAAAGNPPVNTVTFVLWRFEEAALPSHTGGWFSIAQYTTDIHILVDGWAPGVVAHTSPGLLATWTAWADPLSVPPPPIQCRPDGTCTACSIFFQAALPGPSCDPTASPAQPRFEQCAKLAVMPLGGAITTRADWN
jgi:prepilin-type N-terminal cleavage/methylation domain-containing protein